MNEQQPLTTVKELGIEFRGFVALTDERLKNFATSMDRLSFAMEESNRRKTDESDFLKHVAWGEKNVLVINERLDSVNTRVGVLENTKMLDDNSFGSKLKKGLETRIISIAVIIIVVVALYVIVQIGKPEALQLIN